MTSGAEEIVAAAIDAAEEVHDPLEGLDPVAATLQRLAALPPIEYDQARTAEAERLGVRVATLDAEVERRRSALSAENGSDDFLADPEPWPSPVDGAKVLDSLTTTFQAHMVLPAGAAEALALWVVHAHAHDSADISPILGITSPTPECGKTTLLTILGGLVPRALPTANITPAALFRTVERWRPTVLIDEADTFVADNDELRGIVNSGHQRANAYVIRTVGEDFEPKRFCTWAPKVVALIGKLPATWASRAIQVELKRKTAAEQVTPLRLDRLGHLEPMKRQAARFAADNAALLRAADPEVSLDGRPADNWRPLLAVADLAGGEWPARARRIAEGTAERSETTDGIMLLEDIRRIFAERGEDRMASEALVKALAEMEDRPWPEWRNGKSITQRQAAKLLEPFEIRPRNTRMANGTVPKGYKLSAFDDAFARYLPPQSATPLQAAENLGFSGFSSATARVDVADRNTTEPARNLDCSGVADHGGGSGNGYDDDHPLMAADDAEDIGKGNAPTTRPSPLKISPGTVADANPSPHSVQERTRAVGWKARL